MNSTCTLIIIFKSLSFESNAKDNRHFKKQNSTEHVSFNSSYFKMIVQNIGYTLHFGGYMDTDKQQDFYLKGESWQIFSEMKSCGYLPH